MKNYNLVIYILSIFIISGCCEGDEEIGSLEITMNLQYQGEPLVMFQDYIYPDGRVINFSRFSTYISELELDDERISDVGFHNLTDSHVDQSSAEAGYSWRIDDVAVGDYSKLNFGVGVNETNNAKDPGTFESGHPLAKPGEHWFSWSSFVFLKLEANMDSNGDGIKDLPISLHLGADEAYTLLSLDKPTKINSEEVSTINLSMDIFDFLGGDDNTYDIDATPQIHTLDQKGAVIELSENIINSIK